MSGRSSPTPTSSAVAAVAWLASLVILGWQTGLPGVTVTATLAGITFAVAGFTAARTSVPATVGGSLLFICATGLLAASAGLAALSIDGSIAVTGPELYLLLAYVIGCFAAATGVTLLPRQGDSRAVARALLTTSGTTMAVAGTAFLLAFVAMPVIVGVATPVFGPIVAPEASPQALASLVILAGATILLLAVVLVRLPIPALVRRERRSAVRARIERLYRQLLTIGVGSLIAGLLAFLVLPLLWEAVPEAVSDTILTVSASQPLRIGLLVVAAVATLAVGIVAGLRQLHPASAGRVVFFAAHATGALIIVAAVLIAGPDLLLDALVDGAGDAAEPVTTNRAEFGDFAVATGLVAGIFALPTALVFAASGLGAVRILPGRTAGGVIATAGLVGMTIAAGQYTGVSPLLFLVVALAFVLWDVSTFGHRLGIELGQGSRRLELVHGGTVLVVGLVSTGLVYALLILAEQMPRSSAAAAVAALFSILLVVTVVRA